MLFLTLIPNCRVLGMIAVFMVVGWNVCWTFSSQMVPFYLAASSRRIGMNGVGLSLMRVAAVYHC